VRLGKLRNSREPLIPKLTKLPKLTGALKSLMNSARSLIRN
jgi:hypothetical protein